MSGSNAAGGATEASLRFADYLHPSGRLSANVALGGAVVAATGLPVQSLIHAALAEVAQTSEFSGQALQSLNALDGWSFYPLAIGLSTFVLASGVALVRGCRFFAPFLAWAGIALGVLVLVRSSDSSPRFFPESGLW